MSDGRPPNRNRSAASLDVDAIFVALAHPHRRFLLAYLDEHHAGPSGTESNGNARPPEAPTITAIAAAIASEAETRPGFPEPRPGVDSVETSLFHVHVPKLEEVGLVTREEGGTVALTDRWERVRPILEAAGEL